MPDVDRIRAAARKATDRNGSAPPRRPPHDEPWPLPVRLGWRQAMPPFPTNILPGWLEEWVGTVSEAMQTPPDLAGMLALAVAGAALAKRVRVEVRPGWQEPTNLYAVVALAPGERKSPVFTLATEPVQQHEAAERLAMRQVIAEAASQHRILEHRLKAAEALAAKASEMERSRLEEEARQAARALEEHIVPAAPSCYCDDVTPEALARLLARHGGRMLVAAAEGTTFEIAKGRYSESANFDVWLKGHSGDPLRVHRIDREPDEVAQPALSAALAVQPDVISGLAEQASMRGRGFLARWLYAVPESIVGRRQTRPRPVPRETAAAYVESMLQLWRLDGGPYIVGYTAEADDVMTDLERWLEPQMGEDGELSGLAGWAQKLAGAVARLSVILHVADRYAAGTWLEPIRSGSVEAAVRLARTYLLPHAQAAFGLMGADSRIADARRVVRWLGRWLAEHFVDSVNCVNSEAPRGVSRRDIHAGVWGGSRKAEELDGVLDLLVKLEYLRPVELADRRGPGRHPSQRYLVNPNIAEGDPPP